MLGPVRRKLNEAYRQSQQKDRWLAAPNRSMMLSEFYYGSGPSPELIQRIKARMKACLENLLVSKTFREVTTPPLREILDSESASLLEI